jgi:hypothetical protein
MSDKEELLPGSVTQYAPKEGVPCLHGKALGCRDESIAAKKACNVYECPYQPFHISDHFSERK